MLLTHLPVVRLAGILLTTLTVLNAQSATSTATVPRTVRYTGSFRPGTGLPLQPVENITLAVYRDRTGGDPLWQETQNIQPDTTGNFAVEMGATQSEGLPPDLFRTGESRWLGVRFNRPGEAEQPRVQLLSVPYALRASDAESLGGKPASAYLLATPTASAESATIGGASSIGTSVASNGPKAVKALPKVTSGSSNFIGVFTNTTDLGNSVLYQNGNRIGLNTTFPFDLFHVSFLDNGGTATGLAVQNLGSGAAAYSGMLFYDQNGALGQFQGFNNSTHEYRINNIAPSGSINFMLGSASKFQVRSDGDIDLPGSIRKAGTLFLHNLGVNNTSLGLNALPAANTGNSNTAIGQGVLTSNTTGSSNTASGQAALGLNTSGFGNTATGVNALKVSTIGNNNAAFGTNAMVASTGGTLNSALGASALYSNTTGSNNTANGAFSLGFNTSGNNNTAIGYQAGGNLTTGSENIMIGNQGLAADDSTIRIGDLQTKTFITAIRGVTTGQNNAVAVVIDSNGQLGTVSSSGRFKEDINDMGDASSNLMRLRPVTYRYKQSYADGSKPLDYGLIAEEVAEVYPDLVARDKDGQVETVQYHKLTPMLLNELQKQRDHAQEQDEVIRKLEARLATLEGLLSTKAVTTAAPLQ